MTRDGKAIMGLLGILTSLLLAGTLLGIFPWATRAEVQELKTDLGKKLDRIDTRINELHRLFFPPRRDRWGSPNP